MQPQPHRNIASHVGADSRQSVLRSTYWQPLHSRRVCISSTSLACDVRKPYASSCKLHLRDPDCDAVAVRVYPTSGFHTSVFNTSVIVADRQYRCMTLPEASNSNYQLGI